MWVTGVVVAANLATAVRAQAPTGTVLGATRVYSPLAFQAPAIGPPRVINLSVQTSVAVPDGGTALVGGYSQLSEGRVEYGPPGLGKVPYVSRPFRNTAYGRSTTAARVTASVRIISLREEEYRQTGVRSSP
jgi:type II secretory pathway component GspD/PulD (secretin)